MSGTGTGIIVGYIVGEKLRHYRGELKSGKPSASALCGKNPNSSGSKWVENLTDSHAESRMNYDICEGCGAALSS